MTTDVSEDRQRKAAEVESAVAHWHGGDSLYQHWMPQRFRYTEGVKLLADKAGAYWLVDAIMSHQVNRALRSVRMKEFQLWELKVNPDASCVLTCREDSDVEPAVTQEIEYTDFPLDYIKLYLEGSILMLPSEH